MRVTISCLAGMAEKERQRFDTSNIFYEILPQFNYKSYYLKLKDWIIPFNGNVLGLVFLGKNGVSKIGEKINESWANSEKFVPNIDLSWYRGSCKIFDFQIVSSKVSFQTSMDFMLFGLQNIQDSCNTSSRVLFEWN